MQYSNGILLIPSDDGTYIRHAITVGALASYQELLGAADVTETIDLIKAMAERRPDGLDSPEFWKPLFADYRARNVVTSDGMLHVRAAADQGSDTQSSASLSPAQIHARELLGFTSEAAPSTSSPTPMNAAKRTNLLPDGIEQAVTDARKTFRAEIASRE